MNLHPSHSLIKKKKRNYSTIVSYISGRISSSFAREHLKFSIIYTSSNSLHTMKLKIPFIDLYFSVCISALYDKGESRSQLQILTFLLYKAIEKNL